MRRHHLTQPFAHPSKERVAQVTSEMKRRLEALEKFTRGDKVNNGQMRGIFIKKDDMANAIVKFGNKELAVNPLTLVPGWAET